MRAWKQLVALLQMNLGSFEGRLGPAIVTLVGTTCVVGVLISMLSMGTGARLAAENGASPDRAVIETSVAWVGVDGTISQQDAALIASEPGIRQDAEGRPMMSGVFTTTVASYKKSDDSRVFAPVSGVQPEYLRVVPELKLTGGRMFRPGMHEVIVGKTRYTEDRGMAIGDRVWVRDNEWTIVGHFEARGMLDSQLLTDALTLMSAARNDSYSRVLVTLAPPGGFARLRQALEGDPTLHLELKHEAEADLDDAKPITRLLDFISYFIAAVMAAGATVGAVSALYALVEQRRREMATLRALGFGGGPIVLAVLIESMFMAMPGALLGAFAAWALFNGHHISPEGMAFDLTVTPGLVLIGIVWALVMGLLGGLLPALRSARVPVAEALGSV
jgi:putative ABC transport system permease protein